MGKYAQTAPAASPTRMPRRSAPAAKPSSPAAIMIAAYSADVSRMPARINDVPRLDPSPRRFNSPLTMGKPGRREAASPSSLAPSSSAETPYWLRRASTGSRPWLKRQKAVKATITPIARRMPKINGPFATEIHSPM